MFYPELVVAHLRVTEVGSQRRKGDYHMALPQQQQQNNQSLNEKILELFTGTAGVHAVTTIKDGFAKDYFTKDLLDQQVKTRENVYFTPNTSKIWSRKKAHVCQINAITIDLDTYKTGLTKEHALYLLPHVLKEQNIFYPTAIQDSGNGLYLYWRLEPQIVNNQVLVRLYEKITNVLQASLAHLGADKQSTDILHLFRLPGTVNAKPGMAKKESYILELNEHLIYELQDFTDELLPEFKKDKVAKKRRKKARNSSLTHLFNPFTLALARARDLENLAQIRGYDMDGYRHHLLLYYAAFLTQANQDNYQEKVHALNDLLTNPIRENEVKSIFKTIDGKRQGDSDDPYELSYVPKNSTLIETFDISIEEQANMKTVIGEHEYKRRDRKRKQVNYEPIKEKNQNKKQKRNDRIIALKKEGYTNKQIEETLRAEGFEKVSKSTIQRVSRKARE